MAMPPRSRPGSRPDPRPRPALDAPGLESLALHYVARFATSGAKLADYCRRKVRELGWDAEAAPDVPALVARFVEAGYLDDAVFAKGRAEGLRRRGYGDRRVDMALRGAGIAEEDRAGAKGDVAAAWTAALVLARKRRFGPFAAEKPDRERRQKQLSAMLRAGHPLDIARELIDAASEAEALRRAEESQEADV